MTGCREILNEVLGWPSGWHPPGLDGPVANVRQKLVPRLRPAVAIRLHICTPSAAEEQNAPQVDARTSCVDATGVVQKPR